MSIQQSVIVLFFVLTGLAGPGRAASDLPSRREREAVVEKAERLAQPPAVESLGELPNPFDPARFAEAQPPAPKTAETAVAAPPADREVLERIAARIPATGSINFGGQEMLTISIPPYRLTVGDPITVTDQGKEYVLEIVSIAGTNFTVRYRDEELVRPIRSTR